MEIKTLETNDVELFQPEEYRLLNKTVQIREQIVDHMLKDGIPYKTSEIRVLNELLNSIDNNILGKVDKRLKFKENENNNDMKEIVKAIMLESEKRKQEAKSTGLVETLPEDYVLEEVVPGEDSFEYEEITLEEIRGE